MIQIDASNREMINFLFKVREIVSENIILKKKNQELKKRLKEVEEDLDRCIKYNCGGYHD